MLKAIKKQESLLWLAAPLIVSFWMRSLFSLVDTFYAANLADGVAAIAAIGLTIPLEFIFIATWTGLSNALTSHLSKAMTQGNNQNFDQLVAATRKILMVVTPLFGLAGIGLYFLIPFLGLPLSVEKNFQIYGPLIFGCLPLVSFLSIIPDSTIKAHHDTRSIMMAGIYSNLLNVALNTLFTFVFHLGIFGIGFSTVLGSFGGLIYSLRKAAALEKKRRAELSEKSSSENLPAPTGALPANVVALLLALALPASASFLLMSSEGMLVNFLLSRLPDSKAALAAFSIYFRLIMFFMMPVVATSVAMLPFVARYLGQKRVELVSRGYIEALAVMAVYAFVVVGPVLWLGSEVLIRWLAGQDPQTVAYSLFALHLVPFAVLISLPFMLSRPLFEGAQKGRPGLIMALLRYLVFAPVCAFLGMYWIAPPFHGLLYGLIAATGLGGLLFLTWALYFLKQLSKELASN